MLVVQQIGVLDFELEPTPVAMPKRALDADRLRAFGAPVENLRETRTVAVGEQPVEAAPFGLLHRVAEDSLDRRTLIVDDPVCVEDGDHVARVRDQRPETRLALLAMQVLRQRRAFESERYLRCERSERLDLVRGQPMLRVDDERAASLFAHRERREEEDTVSLQLQSLLDRGRHCGGLQRDLLGSRRAKPTSSVGAERARLGDRLARGCEERLVVVGEDEPDTRLLVDDLANGSDHAVGDPVRLDRDEANAGAPQREFASCAPLLLAHKTGHARNDEKEQDGRGDDDHHHVRVVELVGEANRRCDQACESEQNQAHACQADLGVHRLFERPHASDAVRPRPRRRDRRSNRRRR